MFRRLSEPLQLSEASLLALRPALNAPVLNEGFLPVGPARAAVVAFAEEYGGIGLALGVRSNEGGQIVVLRNQESIDPMTSIVDALEPLLAEAERMGFLFDEDMVEGGASSEGRSQAMALWGRLMGDLEMPPPPRAVPPQPAANEPVLATEGPLAVPRGKGDGGVPELMLDDAVVDLPEIDLSLDDEFLPLPPELEEPDADLSLEASHALDLTLGADTVDAIPPSETASERGLSAKPRRKVRLRRRVERGAEEAKTPPSPGSSQELPSPPSLSKFRHVEESGGADAASELGRIPLVRVRREGAKRVPYLARLLSSF